MPTFCLLVSFKSNLTQKVQPSQFIYRICRKRVTLSRYGSVLLFKVKFNSPSKHKSWPTAAVSYFCERFVCINEEGKARETYSRRQTVTGCSLKKHWQHGSDKDSNNTHFKLRVDETVIKGAILHVSIILYLKKQGL